jgi:prophage antirepressor-like protein
MQYCGKIEFGGHILHVFNTLDEPWFQAIEVSKMIDYSVGNTAHMLKQVEQDEKMLVSTRNSNTTARGNAANMWFISELGLYNVLSQSRKPIARGWRRIVHQELINLRRSRKKNIVEQFDDWDEEFEGIYFDEETGMLMQSVTMPGGDVEQIPVE